MGIFEYYTPLDPFEHLRRSMEEQPKTGSYTMETPSKDLLNAL